MQTLWTIQDWQQAYQSKVIVLADLYDYVSQLNRDDHAWISIASPAQLDAQIESLMSKSMEDCPLYGIPFAVKDNIDVQGFYSTAACPQAQYLAQQDATVIAKLKQAGAIVIGKTNLDQFATGLVGIRSPYGAVKNSFHPDYISGGSSSGSAVVVAKGIVPFSLGSDTAGSGRIPAGHNNIVGLKPTKGWFSTTGLIPACRTLDTISIFALNVDDAWRIAQVIQGFDEADEYSRTHPENVPARFHLGKIAIPQQLEFYQDQHSQHAFEHAIQRVIALGYTVEAIDFTVFQQLASALYHRAWVAERTVAVDNKARRADLHPVIQQIIAQADQFGATDMMQDEYDRAIKARQIQQLLSGFDALMVPTAPTIYTIAEVEADPLVKNSHMGIYTNFVNFADLSAIAVPNVIRDDGLPSGVTFIAKAWHDQALADFAQRWQQSSALPLGTSQCPYQQDLNIASEHEVKLAVVGAHLTDMPLNIQLTTRQSVLLAKTQTAPHYQLFALSQTTPPKPGLQYVEQGHAIEVEVWLVPLAMFGKIVAEVPAPLGIGNIQLADGSWVKGFICEDYAIQQASNISHFGGWKNFIKAQHSVPLTPVI